MTGYLAEVTSLQVLVAFSGFLINHTPVFFRWISKMSFVTFAYSAIYQNELNGLQLKFTGADGAMLPDAGIALLLPPILAPGEVWGRMSSLCLAENVRDHNL